MANDFGAHDPDDLIVPFCFVPHGAPEPTEWLARHPDNFRIPATFVPRRSQQHNPHEPTPSVATTAASVATPARSSEWVAPTFAFAEDISGLLADAAPFWAAVGIMWPSKTAPREIDERPGGFIPPQPPPALPGLIPPDTRVNPVEGGLTPATPAAPLPGFTPDGSAPIRLPGREAEENSVTVFQQNRNDGLEGGARTHSERARKAAESADPAVTKALRYTEWEAHHLISIAGLHATPDLIRGAVRAGWKTDEQGNVAPLPATPEAQRKLREQGVRRPVHDNAHRNWNKEVLRRLEEIQRKLEAEGLLSDTDAYDRRAREQLEKLQKGLRQKMLLEDKLSDNDVQQELFV